MAIRRPKSSSSNAPGISDTAFPVLDFASAEDWSRWLSDHHQQSAGVWLRFAKKSSGAESITHAQALEAALCYGWIDGQLKPGDAVSWTRKFTPRRARSIWSKRNREQAEQLIQAGRMRPAGLAAIAAAKSDGRWDRAYDSPKNMQVPDDFRLELKKHPAAQKFFATLNKANLYAIAWRLQTAKKQETRERRMKAILQSLSDGKPLH